MAELIHITTPNAPRDYSSNSNHNRGQNIHQNPTGQVFDLGNQTQIVKTNERSEQGQQNLKDDSGSVLMQSPSNTVKTPSAALNAAKELISREAISLIREAYGTDTLNKVTEFASEVMQSPESLAGDMVSQQKNATIYGDRMWGVLKDIIDMTGSEAMKNGLADFAKAVSDAASKDEILRSLSASFRFLAGECAPGKAVADELNAAANALSGADAAENFGALKSTLLQLLSYTEKSLLLNDDTKNLLPLIVHTMSRFNDNPDSIRDSFEALLSLSENISLSAAQLEALGLDPNSTLGDNLSALFDKFIQKNEYLSSQAKEALLMNNASAEHQAKLRSAVNLLAAGAKHMTARISGDSLMNTLGTIDYSTGTDALRRVLGSVIPNTPAMRDALQTLFYDLEETGNLDRMIDNLNAILENIGEEDENMIRLAQGMNNALSEMAASGRYNITSANAMETLTDFLTKNINNSFLQSLSGMNSSEMASNMLSAPGIFAPLLHHFAPLDAFGLKGFGELWVDPNADELVDKVKGRENGTKNGSHLFLCFDIEDTGYFELEIYEKDKNMTVMLLCPEALTDKFAPIRGVIPKIAAENGYHAAAALVEPLKARRSLDQVFPKLSEQRANLNIKV